ncbi:MAG: hypothetical protein L0Y62_00670, partial [Nitrospirae bacterium]|nr:hypothetical protein [Nitrospirota bacterium]
MNGNDRRYAKGKVIEKRECNRFVIPGATVTCRREGLLFFKSRYLCAGPVLDVSRGGLCFLTDRYIPSATKVVIEV